MEETQNNEIQVSYQNKDIDWISLLCGDKDYMRF